MGKEKEKTSFKYNFLFMLNVFLCPWVISKKFKINNKIYAYSASVLAAVSCILATISLLK